MVSLDSEGDVSHRKRVRYIGETGAIVVQTRSAMSLITMVDLSQHGAQTAAFHDSSSCRYGNLDEHKHRFPNLDRVAKISKGKHYCILIKLYRDAVMVFSYKNNCLKPVIISLTLAI